METIKTVFGVIAVIFAGILAWFFNKDKKVLADNQKVKEELKEIKSDIKQLLKDRK